MLKINNLEKAANAAIRKLRMQKLQNGLPFMINSNELPTRHCYLEYADGKIELVFLAQGSTNFTVVRKLTKKGADAVRRKCKLL